MFTHNVKGKVPHKHETVNQARLCERGFRTTTTVFDREPDGTRAYREARHQSPCVCGPYDRCWEFRVAGARKHMDLFKAYND